MPRQPLNNVRNEIGQFDSGQELCFCDSNCSALSTPCQKQKELVLSKQILRCGTSIGANIEEAIGGQSKADFVAKLNISYKETRETIYWLRLLKDTDYLTATEFSSIHKDAEEICKIITAILKTTKANS